MEYTLQRDLIYSNMRQNAAEISARLVHAHMRKEPLDLHTIRVKKGFRMGLYDRDAKAILTQIEHPVDLHLKSYQRDGHLGIVDSSVLGHMGVHYVVITFLERIGSLTIKILLAFTLIFLLIAAIGYRLAKIFIKPIQDEREKRNNFIKDSTHELNTPITALLMSTSSPDLMNPKNIERIRLSARRISELYEDLTYLFLYDKSEKPKEPIAFDRLLEAQIGWLMPFAEKKGISLVTEIEPFSFTIDKESATRLINNLISNAIKYSEKGDTVTITLKNGTLTVKDSGIGIDAQKLKDIFQRYYRATSRSGGFGIGLDMVRTIAQNYDITIDVTSKIGEGTEFILRFPQ